MAKHRNKKPRKPILQVIACLITIGLLLCFSALNDRLYYNSTANAVEAPKTSIKITINGKQRRILAEPHKTIKAALDENGITLEPDSVISPTLESKVKEDTAITITAPETTVETSEEPIPFSTVKKETSTLPKGQEKTETEGQNGVMEATKLVIKTGDKIVHSNVFTAQVKTPPTDKVILVGTLDPTSQLGITTPTSEIQKWAHDYLLANGYTEDDFTAANHIINHESGWSPTATNPSSGAYGLGQALPGSKMSVAGADWQTNYQTQFKWFIQYCETGYGSIQNAYAHWVSVGNY
ncbi:G5 domain-containing protein [Bifidobacterium callitrichidarum]|uniref:G5 domain-containing protein n=1 Tax=Bifidobacterium callitrichidarum TaxID=2052941 RepID=A0A2U2NCA4_9BIFI|nr:G5 domain-containing protein [Bifidobacterium callitrichidarum]PWG66664.1 hypothetical protein DF196_01820 [Bifidobacterium callitrichidarum]